MSEQLESGDNFTSAYNHLANYSPASRALREKFSPYELYYFRRVIEVVAEHAGISANAICSTSQPRFISKPRHCAQFILRHNPLAEEARGERWEDNPCHAGVSYPTLGKIFGRDHKSVCYGVSSFEHFITRPLGLGMREVFRNALEQLRREELA